MIFPFGPSSNSSPKMASIWLWSAAPLMFVAGSRPAGQSPEKPVHSSTVSVPPAFGVPLLACVVVLDVLLPPQAATTRPSSSAVPPRQNLRTVPVVAVAPSLIPLTHSYPAYVTIRKSSVLRFVLDIRIRPEKHQGCLAPDAGVVRALVPGLAQARAALVPHPQRLAYATRRPAVIDGWLRGLRNRRDREPRPGQALVDRRLELADD